MPRHDHPSQTIAASPTHVPGQTFAGAKKQKPEATPQPKTAHIPSPLAPSPVNPSPVSPSALPTDSAVGPMPPRPFTDWAMI